MGNLAAWLLAMAAPLAARVLASLGIVWLTYESVGLLVTAAQGQVAALWGGMPLAMLQLATLSGLTGAVGILLGGMAARAALTAVSRLGKKP